VPQAPVDGEEAPVGTWAGHGAEDRGEPAAVLRQEQLLHGSPRPWPPAQKLQECPKKSRRGLALGVLQRPSLRPEASDPVCERGLRAFRHAVDRAEDVALQGRGRPSQGRGVRGGADGRDQLVG